MIVSSLLSDNPQYESEMKKLKRLQWFHYLAKGKNLKEVMKENKYYSRYINHLGKLSKNALPF